MTREEYAAKYGVQPFSGITATATPEPQGRGAIESLFKRPIERLILEPGRRFGEAVGYAAVSPFLNEEQKARALASTQEDADIGGFTTKGIKGIREIAGEALETAAYLAPTPAKGLPARAGAGAGSGYAFETGAELQEGMSPLEAATPGLTTAVGAILPVIGSLVGKFPKKIEETNLRMTPTEKSNLARQGKDIAAWAAKQKLIGSPETRYAKVDQLYDDMERKITSVVDSSKVTFPKKALIEELQEIPAKYADNLSEYDGVVSKVGKMIETLNTTRGESITASALNNMKRAEWKSAYNKQGSDVINDVSNEVAHRFKEVLDDAVPGLKALNPEYGNIIAARRVLFKAISRPQTGLVGKLLGAGAGAGVGGAVAGPAGAAAGALVGEQVAAKVLGTATRSTAGSTVQAILDLARRLPPDKFGNIQISQKALLSLLEQLLGSSPQP